MTDEYYPPYDNVETPEGNTDPPIYENERRDSECYETGMYQEIKR